jgi:hypothetical protein
VGDVRYQRNVRDLSQTTEISKNPAINETLAALNISKSEDLSFHDDEELIPKAPSNVDGEIGVSVVELPVHQQHLLKGVSLPPGLSSPEDHEVEDGLEGKKEIFAEKPEKISNIPSVPHAERANLQAPPAAAAARIQYQPYQGDKVAHPIHRPDFYSPSSTYDPIESDGNMVVTNEDIVTMLEHGHFLTPFSLVNRNVISPERARTAPKTIFDRELNMYVPLPRKTNDLGETDAEVEHQP